MTDLTPIKWIIYLNKDVSKTVTVTKLKSSYYSTKENERNRRKYDSQNDSILVIVLMHQSHKQKTNPENDFLSKTNNLHPLAC